MTRNTNTGRLSLGTTFCMVSMLKVKANAAKRAISYHLDRGTTKAVGTRTTKDGRNKVDDKLSVYRH